MREVEARAASDIFCFEEEKKTKKRVFPATRRSEPIFFGTKNFNLD